MTPERRVAIVTLGCKVNAYDSAAIADRLRAEGCVVVPPETSAFAESQLTVSSQARLIPT